jgi:hypothetical protein
MAIVQIPKGTAMALEPFFTPHIRFLSVLYRTKKSLRSLPVPQALAPSPLAL